VSEVVSLDGDVVAPADARVSVFDRGFLYGDSVFEVIRTYQGEPFACREHLERLARSCGQVGMAPPVDLAGIERDIHKALEVAGNGESYIRVVLTRGAGPINLDPAVAVDPRQVIIIIPLVEQPPEVYARGVAVALINCARGLDGTPAAGAKASNYLANALALREAKRRGAYEPVLLNPMGIVLEGASTNVFIVRRGHIETPPVSLGILDGITRRYMLKTALRLGIPTKDALLTPNDLYQADEVFITSTLREAVPVVRVDDRVVGSGTPGPVATRMRGAFFELVAELRASEKGG
jgi:branched-chain amino acid aminotransferase